MFFVKIIIHCFSCHIRSICHYLSICMRYPILRYSQAIITMQFYKIKRKKKNEKKEKKKERKGKNKKNINHVEKHTFLSAHRLQCNNNNNIL